MAVNLKAPMSMDNRGFVRGADQAKGAVGKLSTAMGTMKGIIGAGIFAGAIAGMRNLTTGAMKAADDVMNFSARMGVSAKVVQELQIEAAEAGIAFKGLMTGFGTLARTSQEAAAGNKKYADSFQALGVEMSELNSMSQEEMFFALADTVQSSSDRVETLGHLFNVLGGQAEKLLPILDAIGKRNEDVLGEDTVKQLDRMNDGWEKTKRSVKNFGSEMTAAIGMFGEEIFAGGKGNIFKNIGNLGGAFFSKLTGGSMVDPDTGEHRLSSLQAARERHKVNEAAKKKEIEGQAALKKKAEEQERLEKEAEQRRKDEEKFKKLMEKIDDNAFKRRLKTLNVEHQIREVKEKIAEAQERANRAQIAGDDIRMANELLGIQKLSGQLDSIRSSKKLSPIGSSMTPMQSVGAMVGRAPFNADRIQESQLKKLTGMEKYLDRMAFEMISKGLKLRNINDY